MKTQVYLPFSLIAKLAYLFSLMFILSACSSEESGLSTDRDPDADASYKVTFTTAWTAVSFPANFPSGAHFSGLVGGTHNDQVRFWEIGQNASAGIESMAETGSQSALAAEVELAKSVGSANFVLGGQGNAAAGSVELEFDINELYPLVTLVSMVAPSPDWFVGVSDLSLYDDTAGDWKQTLEVSLKVYDAGTDSGLVFTAADDDTQPPELIVSLTSDPIDTDFIDGVGPGGEFIATFSFERIK